MQGDRYMSIIFGYDRFVNGEPLCNGYDFVNEESPPNYGLLGYRYPQGTADADRLTIQKEIFYPIHGRMCLKSFINIDFKQVGEIKERYYYVIDVIANDFWGDTRSKDLKISDLALNDIKTRKCKILVLCPLEGIQVNFIVNISNFINYWGDKYNLPEKSIIVISGNYSFTEDVFNSKYATHISYSHWESLMSRFYNTNYHNTLINNINEKKNRSKIFLNYNRRARLHRCKTVYRLMQNDLIKYGFISLGKHDSGRMAREIPKDFYNLLPLSFDDTNLEINHATELVYKDFLDSYVSLLSETLYAPGEIFMTEKIFKPILGMHPFIVSTSPGFLEEMKRFGYKTFSRWFDESYDKEEILDKRIDMTILEIKKLTMKSEDELQNMLIEMLPTLQHNVDVFLKRTSSNTFQKILETELWK
jgi:hypothetical protein